MRKTRQQVIEELLPAYFEGRSEAFKERFNARDLDHQYTSINAWNRRVNGKASAAPVRKGPGRPKGSGKRMVELPHVAILRNLRQLGRYLENGVEINDKELAKINAEVELLKEKLVHYEDIRRNHALKKLEKARKKLDKEIEELKSMQTSPEA